MIKVKDIWIWIGIFITLVGLGGMVLSLVVENISWFNSAVMFLMGDYILADGISGKTLKDLFNN